MKRLSMMNFFRIVVQAAILICSTVSVSQSAVLKAMVRDIDGKPSEGVKIFLYESTNVRKPANFISALTDKNDRISIIGPAGKFWAVARLKKDALYGPLMSGD